MKWKGVHTVVYFVNGHGLVAPGSFIVKIWWLLGGKMEIRIDRDGDIDSWKEVTLIYNSA